MASDTQLPQTHARVFEPSIHRQHGSDCRIVFGQNRLDIDKLAADQP